MPAQDSAPNQAPNPPKQTSGSPEAGSSDSSANVASGAPHSPKSPRKKILLAIAGLVVLAAAAFAVYSLINRDSVPENQAIVPAEASSAWQEHTIDDKIAVSTPGDWEESVSEESEQDAVSYSFQAPVNEHGTRGGLGVIVIGDPDRDAKTAAEAVETNYSAIVQITSDVLVEEVVWPGAEEAWFVEFTAELSNDDGERAPHVTQHLVLDFDDGTQVIANVSGLTSDFDDHNFGDALASLKVL